MKRIFVTGGSGYIGSVVVKELVGLGYDVAVFDNIERGHRCNVPPNVRLIVGDLRNADEIKAAIGEVKPEAVMHFAAYALVGESMSDPLMYFNNNGEPLCRQSSPCMCLSL